MAEEIKSIASKNRIQSLDVLRGFALLGIALVNVLGFNASFFDFGGYYDNLPNPEQQKFYHTLISLTADKFIFIYSFLFGYGFHLQYSKYGSEKSAFKNYYIRRLLFLAIFGIIHIIFLWAGDILLLYAIGGFILLIIRKVPAKTALIVGFIFYFFISIWLIISIWIPLPNGLSSTCTECMKDALQIYPVGNYFECLKLRIFEYYSFRNINLFYYLPKVIGVFVFGSYASQFKLHNRISAQRLKWFGVFLLIAIIGIILYFYYEKWVFYLLPDNNSYMNSVYMGAYELMNLFIALSYILFIMLLTTFKFNLFAPFTFVGRMSLSNYIMQSLLFSIIFYGWGMGKFGMKEPGILIWYAISIYIFQLILSYFWLKIKKQGPLEWLWRKLSYKT